MGTPSDDNGIVVVTQLDPISVIFPVSEDGVRQFVERYRTGAGLTVTIHDREFTRPLGDGVVDSIDNRADENTGTVKVRAVFHNADGALLPNQFVGVAVRLDTLHDVVTVPAGAVLLGPSGAFVYRVDGDARTVSARTIRTGAVTDGRVAVLSGLAAGDRVVSHGADRLYDGARITVPP